MPGVAVGVLLDLKRFFVCFSNCVLVGWLVVVWKRFFYLLWYRLMDIGSTRGMRPRIVRRVYASQLVCDSHCCVRCVVSLSPLCLPALLYWLIPGWRCCVLLYPYALSSWLASSSQATLCALSPPSARSNWSSLYLSPNVDLARILRVMHMHRVSPLKDASFWVCFAYVLVVVCI